MKTDGLFTVHSFTIPCKTHVPIKLIIFGDVHRDAPLHAEEKWQEFCDYARKQKGAFYLGMGDYFDSFSTSERAVLGNHGLHESSKKNFEKNVTKQVGEFAKEISFMRGRLIGLIGGNHTFYFQSGISSDQLLCEHLETTYLGVCSFVRLSLVDRGHHSNKFDMFLHHGAGGGRLLGSSFNRVDQCQDYIDADFFCMGHDHMRGVVPARPKLYPHMSGGRLGLRERRAYVARSGSYLKAYEPGESSYNVDAARGPCNLGHIELELTVTREQKNGSDNGRLEIRGIS
jgi:hypothetical protein